MGCGYGYLIDYLPRSVERLVLIDRSEKRRQLVESRLAGAKAIGQFVHADIEYELFHFEFSPVETVVMAALLEHLKAPETAFKNVYELLQPNGSVVVTTPTWLGGKIHVISSWLGLTNREAAREHQRFYNRQSLTQLMVETGFILEQYERFQLGLNQLAVGRKRPDRIVPKP